ARQAGGESAKAIKYHILKREVDSNRQLYDTMLQQLKQSDIAAAMRASNVRVIDPARIPASPYKPDATLSSGLGLLSGVFLVITSAEPSEGKSTVASNLGIAVAETGKKVLLIDGDLRKPKLQDIFGVTNQRGLSDLLRNHQPVNGSGGPDGQIRPTKVPGLF